MRGQTLVMVIVPETMLLGRSCEKYAERRPPGPDAPRDKVENFPGSQMGHGDHNRAPLSQPAMANYRQSELLTLS